MAEPQKIDFNIKTITPVHIGSGDVYMSSEYFLDKIEKNGKVYPVFRRIDLTKYFNSLDSSQQNKFSKNLLKPNYKLSKLSTEFERYFSYNRCNSRPNPGNEIHENIKVLDRPYIPGSSIKGAIENAILFNTLSFEDIENICGNYRGINESVIKTFFAPSGNPQNSIMRFLQISDSTPAVRPYIYDIQTIKVNKNKPVSKQMKLYYETIIAKKLSSRITTTFDSEFYEKLNVEDKGFIIDIDYIKESLFNFNNELIDYEIEFSDKYGINKSKSFYKSLKKKNSKNNPLLRLGANKGLFANTINLKVKSYGFDYFNKVKNNIGGKKAKFEYPVTRRIISKTQYPVGWVQLNFKGE